MDPPLNVAEWKILADAVRGTSHQGNGKPCQDAFRTISCGPCESILVVALSDGAGSANFADVGATLTCDSLIGSIISRIEKLPTASQFTRQVFLEVFTDARIELIRETERRGCSLRELACTALLAVMSPDAAAFAQLGDGAIVIARGDRYEPVFWPQEGEYANETNFLTEDDFANALEAVVVDEPIYELAAFSDGLQRLALDYTSRSGHLGFFRPLFQRLQTEENLEQLLAPFRQFLDSARINARTDDDKTLVLATRTVTNELTTENR